MRDKLRIVWNTGIDASGYSSCARSYIRALHQNPKASVKAYISNVAKNINAQGLDRDELLFFSRLTTREIPEDHLSVTHSVPERMVLSKRKNILYTVCELQVPKIWTNICNNCDLVMTASSFCKEKLVESGVLDDKIKIVPHCHDISIWNENVKSLNIENLRGYNFLFVGDFTPRKNGDLLIDNFVRTFAGNKDVSLTIKGYFNSFKTEDQKRLLRRIRRCVENSGVGLSQSPPIFFYGEPILENLMPRFMASFDCLISPHRCEGWGLNLSQGQFLHKPVISTNYSGNLDFMNKDISYLIDIDGFEKVCDEMVMICPNYEGFEWAKINRDSLCDTMRHVFNNQDEARQKGIEAGKFMKDKFSYGPISDLLVNVLEKFKG